MRSRFAGKMTAWLVGVTAMAIVGLLVGSRWLPRTAATIDPAHEVAAAEPHNPATAGRAQNPRASVHDHGYDDHDDHHDHKHADKSPEMPKKAHAATKEPDHKHSDADALKLSDAAQKTVGVRLAKVELRPFERTLTVPAMVVERPGRSTIHVAAPLTGVVTRIWPMAGETVAAGQPLVDLRLTHEEVVEAQADFLRTAEELDVVRREIARLESASADGVIPGKLVLDRRYEQQKLEGVFRAQRQRLLLHGLSPDQIDQIASKRTLLGGFTVSVPEQKDEPVKPNQTRALQIEDLKVSKGQHVKAGDPLCVLADYAVLYIQGKAFEQDAAVLDKAATNDWRVTAVAESGGGERQTLPGLPIVHLANKIEPESRALPFYVELPNKLVRDRKTPDGHRFSGWQFKPGQRVQLLVPVERWGDRIVLPLSAVVQEGAESYVFEENHGHYDRRSVRVEYRDQFSAVIANDGTLALGKMVIVAGAYQIHLALKNQSGGAPDPHAGHNH